MNVRNWAKAGLRLLMASLVWLGATTAQAQPDPDSAALAFLSQFPRVAIGFSHARGGFGHYATGVNVMKKLRSMGYTGFFELYIDPEVRSEMATLLPGYSASGSPKQSLPGWNAETRPMPGYRADRQVELSELSRNTPIRRIGLIGGDDARTVPAQMGVDAVIVMQPPGWTAPPVIRIQGNNNQFAEIALTGAAELPFKMALPSINEVPAFLRDQLLLSRHAQKLGGLLTLAARFDQHELLTAYGLGTKAGAQKLGTLAQAAMKFRKKYAEKARGRGTVIILLSNLNDVEWRSFEIDSPKSRVVSIEDPGLASKLDALAAEDLLVVKVGSVPQEIWNFLMLKSTLPPTVGGTSGLNFLGLLGEPFILTFGTLRLCQQKELILMMSDVEQGLRLGDDELIADFYAESRTPGSLTRKLFADHAAHLRLLPDKIEEVLVRSQAQLCPMIFGGPESGPSAGQGLVKSFNQLRGFFRRLVGG